MRSDTAFAAFEDPASKKSGSTLTTMLLGSYKLTPDFAPLIRVGYVSNNPPEIMGKSNEGGAVLNPVVGGTYVFKLSSELRLAVFLGVTIPVGGGGGDHPTPAAAAARGPNGIYSRSALDNAMFAVNDFTVFPGLDFAYVGHGFTAQIEATLLQLTRVRGAEKQVDKSRTNFTAGLHVGYFFIPAFSAGAELRYQRWLSTPDNVKKDMTGTLRDTLSFAIGVRAHVKLSESLVLRPGVAYVRGLDAPMSKQHYDILQLDVPLQF